MDDRTTPDRNGDDRQIEAFLKWVNERPSRAEAARILSEFSGAAIDPRYIRRLVTDRRWDRRGLIRDAWLAHPDSLVSDPGPATEAGAAQPDEAGAGAAEDRGEGSDAQPDGDAGDSLRAGSDGNVEGKEKSESADGDGDEFLPRGMALEDMVAVIDARLDAEAGENAVGLASSEVAENVEWDRQRMLQAETVEEIAAHSGAPVLAEVPDLDLDPNPPKYTVTAP